MQNFLRNAGTIKQQGVTYQGAAEDGMSWNAP